MRQPDEEELEELDRESTFFDTNQPMTSDDYSEWIRISDPEEDDDSLFVLGGGSKDLPYPLWLAFHSRQAREVDLFPNRRKIPLGLR